MNRDAQALTLTGEVRVPTGAAVHPVAFEVVGVPAQAPETLTAEVRDDLTGAHARMIYRPDWRSVAIELPGHTTTLAHNPDGSWSAAGETFDTLSAAARALATGDALNALTAELLIASTVALGDAVLAANTRFPDGWCDPVWYEIDPDCVSGRVAVPLGFGQAYACDRWGAESSTCAFFQAYTP